MKYLMAKWSEKIWWWVAYRLPKRLVYFAAMRLIVHGTCGKYSKTEAPKLTAMDAVGRWSKDYWGFT